MIVIVFVDQSMPSTPQPAGSSAMTWQQHGSMEIGASALTQGHSHTGLDPTKTHSKENEDVEIMSSDSSSSSSSED